MVFSDKTYTLQDFVAFSEAQPDKLLELIEGRIVEKVTSEMHGKIVGIILFALINYLKNHPDIQGHWSTEATFAPADDEENSRRPDVSLRLTQEGVSTSAIVVGMPDFAVEVKSPSNTYKELRNKAHFYIEHGAKLVWLVYPIKEIIEVYFAGGTSELFLSDDTLRANDILPNFELPISEIFNL